MRPRTRLFAFVALVLAIDIYLYFRHAAHFFQADSLFLLDHRAHSIADFLRDFIQRHWSGWYRPLAFEVVESILFPFLGLNPIGYRIPLYGVFIAVTVAAYVLTLRLTSRHLAAALATLFFSVHMVNAYTTYDIGFMPELQYAFFYVAAAIAYLEYLRSGKRSAFLTSLACFAGSLLSKEAAATLPATLFVLHLLFDPKAAPFRTRASQAIRSLLPHAALLTLYLIFAVGYIQVAGVDITKLFERPAVSASGAYQPVLDKTVVENTGLALSFGFNIPAGFWAQWQTPGAGTLLFLQLFRALILAGCVVLVIRGNYRAVLLGIAWFFITVSPALPLFNHFIPYYLFLPVIGLSLVVGVIFTSIYDRIIRVHRAVANAVLVLAFGGMFIATHWGIRADIRNNRLLGGSAKLALNTLNDLKRLYPSLPAGSSLFIDDNREPIAWDQSWGGLIRMAYDSKDIRVRYASEGERLNVRSEENTIVLRAENGRIFDDTAEYRRDPERFTAYHESDVYAFELSTSEVIAGKGSYSIVIRGAPGAVVHFSYKLNDGPPDEFPARLDGEGRITFDVSADTPKGVYSFLGFYVEGDRRWIRVRKEITIR
jgi:hypothetical protein